MCFQVASASGSDTPDLHVSYGEKFSVAPCPNQRDTASAYPRSVSAAGNTTEALGDVVGMDVMHRLQPQVRQRQRFPSGQHREDLRVEMSRRGEGM